MTLHSADLKLKTIVISISFREEEVQVEIPMPSCFKEEWAIQMMEYAKRPGQHFYCLDVTVPFEQRESEIPELTILDIFPLDNNGMSSEEIQESLFGKGLKGSLS
jgi:hypothetical protein